MAKGKRFNRHSRILSHRVRIRYVSKAYREYMAYMEFKYGSFIGMEIQEQINMKCQESGFLRTLLNIQKGVETPKPTHSERYLQYQKDTQPYNRNRLYAVPEGWREEAEKKRKERDSAMMHSLLDAMQAPKGSRMFRRDFGTKIEQTLDNE